ncbi:MAG: NAD(P)(+) transhydrogenase (Re/Si-specific) subunit beta [Pleurocapsa sp. MO_226.B13]|nr:NAD(P)(+) transhydrogenase (Re/Si-specific) subunit beta [Pleurocapsa sp. MO_226.B13]
MIKRSMRTGFVRVDNELFARDKTTMLFGSAQDVVEQNFLRSLWGKYTESFGFFSIQTEVIFRRSRSLKDRKKLFFLIDDTPSSYRVLKLRYCTSF